MKCNNPISLGIDLDNRLFAIYNSSKLAILPISVGRVPVNSLSFINKIINNKYNTGISIYKNRFKDIIHLGEIFVKWEDIKKRFWNTIKETFLNYYK